MTVLSWLPLSWMRGLAVLIAWIAWQTNARAARTTVQNIGYCFPNLSDADQKRLAKESLQNTASAICEMPAILRSSYPRLKRWIQSVEGESLLVNNIGKQPLLILIPHYGNWEFLTTYLHEITPYSCLYSPRRLYQLDELVNNYRSRFGGEFLPVTYEGLREVLKRLKDGKVLIVLPDQVPVKGRGAESRFFERRILTGTLVHTLVRRGGLNVVTLAAKRVHGGFSIHVQSVNDSIHDQDETTSVLALDQAIEQVVALDPAQYQWEYKRFRGVAEIYDQ